MTTQVRKIFNFDFGIKSLINDIRKGAVARKQLHQAMRELNSLSDRELADLGIHRSEIRQVAIEGKIR